jgi:tellurite resistance protein TehA-like permease
LAIQFWAVSKNAVSGLRIFTQALEGMKPAHSNDKEARKAVCLNNLADFSPGYFALVMATGIVSLACHLQGWRKIALGLFALNISAYLTLWLITGLRFIRFHAQFMRDLTHHSRGAAFLTEAAGTCILGSQCLILMYWAHIAVGLWIFGFGLGVVLSYTFFTAVTFCEPKPSLATGISGSWLLVIVSTESISVLGALVATSTTHPDIALFVSLASFLCGAMLYVFFATLILYRWIFFSMPPEKMTPDYWIDMGALAITALAGTVLLRHADDWTFLSSLAPFLTGATLFFWATATWWIPLLLAAEAWRHLRGRVRFEYGPEYWALVFPLAMYAVATAMLAKSPSLAFLKGIAGAFTYIAFGVWIIVFAGMSFSLIRPLLRAR